MRWFALILLAGCGGSDDPVDSSTSTTTGTGTTGSTTPSTGDTVQTTPPPALASPAEASDLDSDPDVLHVEITAAPHEFLVGEATIDGYAYNGQVPGPTLRAKLGDRLVVDFTNQLSDPTTIHWHGVHVPWEMDGITWMQDPIPAGGSFRYEFTLEQAGTFWYHPHFDTAHQVDHGLYGVLVVEDPAEPVADHDEVWVFDSWGEEAWTEGHNHTPDPTARTWTVNGLVRPQWSPDGGSHARVRILNASNAGYLSIDDLVAIGGDQGLAAAATTGVLLGSGDRAEVDLPLEDAVLRTAPYAAAGGEAWGDPIDLLTVDAALASAGAAPSWPFSGEAPSADPGTTDVRWSLNGGTGGAASWTINGEAFPDITVPQLPLDQPAVIEIRNLSASEHPFHIHGMSFEVLSVDGVAPAVKTIEDTFNLAIGQTARLLVQPGGAGEWMAHCHILPHAEGGMMTVLSVQ